MLAIGCLSIDCIILKVVLGKHYGPVRRKRPHDRYERTHRATKPSSSVQSWEGLPRRWNGEDGMALGKALYAHTTLFSEQGQASDWLDLRFATTSYRLPTENMQEAAMFRDVWPRIDDHVVIPEVC